MTATSCLLLTWCLSGGSSTLTRSYSLLDATLVRIVMSFERYFASMFTAFTTSVTGTLHFLAFVLIMAGMVVISPFLMLFGFIAVALEKDH
jgi:hypothetical protein